MIEWSDAEFDDLLSELVRIERLTVSFTYMLSRYMSGMQKALSLTSSSVIELLGEGLSMVFLSSSLRFPLTNQRDDFEFVRSREVEEEYE